MKPETKVIRVNVEDRIFNMVSLINNVKNSLHLQIATKNNNIFNINNSDITSYWYRRGKLQTMSSHIDDTLEVDIVKSINKHLADEKKYKEDYIITSIETCVNQRIGSYYVRDVNKMNLMNVAGKVGFDIPETIITGSKNNLTEFVKKHKNVVVKPVASLFVFLRKNCHRIAFTM